MEKPLGEFDIHRLFKRKIAENQRRLSATGGRILLMPKAAAPSGLVLGIATPTIQPTMAALSPTSTPPNRRKRSFQDTTAKSAKDQAEANKIQAESSKKFAEAAVIQAEAARSIAESLRNITAIYSRQIAAIENLIEI
ncbi:unnamed protein product [Ceratitis capitata]|uniref:(Mediterranean fruit fly) hypothetical protein n=1 Tax=Ceratitis capitata TaxID=7213 RepID=A0A811US73_CERCA|nr:unnamed protein product [Ceratitis capitata]